MPPVLAWMAAWSWRLLVIAGAVGAVIYLLGQVLLLVIPFLLALLTTALLTPVAGWLRRHRVPRGLSTLLTMVLAVAILGSVGFYVVDRAIAGYPGLATQTSNVVTRVQTILTSAPFHLDRASVQNIGSTITQQVHKHQSAIASGVFQAGKTALDVLTGALLWLFLTIFMVYDGDRVWDWFVGLFPRSGQERVRGAGWRAWKTLTGYIGGQFLVAMFHGIVIGISLGALGAPLVAPLALIVFIGSFIPIIGALIGGGFAVLVVFVSLGAVKGLVLLAILLVENQIEGHLLQPLVVGRYVRLHPIAIAATLTGGTLLVGLPGAIFGVPAVACINAAAKYLAGREDIDGHPLARTTGDPPVAAQTS